MCAAWNGNADTVRLLIDAGAAIEAGDNVSKRISICTCVCVCVCVCPCALYSCVIVYDKWKVSFYSVLILYYCDV